MVDFVFNRFKFGLGQEDFNLAEANDDLQVSLHTSTYTANQDTDLDFADVSNELSGTGYTAGGADLASQTWTQDDTDNEAVLDAADTAWTGIDAGTASQAILYQNTGTAGTSLLIAHIDTGGFPVVTNGGDLTIQWNAEGILNIT